MTRTPDYFTDRSHILITGITGARTDYGGKTALANWWADNHGRASAEIVIFGNFKSDSGPEKHADAVVHDVESIAHAIADGAEFICYSPRTADWEAASQRLQAAVQALPNDMEKFVVLDEAPELDEEVILWFCRVAGNGNNTKTLLLSQNPGDMPSGLRTQVILCWIGPATGNNKHVFRTNSRLNHFEYIREEHEPYVWTVMTGPDDADRDTFDPVPEEYAG